MSDAMHELRRLRVQADMARIATTPAPEPSEAVWSDPITIAKYGTEVTPAPSEALDDLLSAIDAGHAISSNWVRRVVTDLRRAEQEAGTRAALDRVGADLTEAFTDAIGDHHSTVTDENDEGTMCGYCEEGPWPCDHAAYCLDAIKVVSIAIAAHRERIGGSP